MTPGYQRGLVVLAVSPPTNPLQIGQVKTHLMRIACKLAGFAAGTIAFRTRLFICEI